MNIKKFFKQTWGVVITILLFLLLIIVFRTVKIEALLYLVQDNIILVSAMYVVIHFIADLFAPIGTSPLFIAGFYLMGDWVYLVEFISATICAIANFILARKFGKQALSFFVTEYGISRIYGLIKRFEKIPIYYLRIFTFSFNDYASYAYGLTNVSFFRYLYYSVLTNLVWVLVWKFVLADTITNVFVFFVWFYLMSVPFFAISYIQMRKK